MTNEISVLDHGFVRLDGLMVDLATLYEFVEGNTTLDELVDVDLSVVNSARVSFGLRKKAVEAADEMLIAYLMKHHHGTPFEHNAFRFHVKAPLFIFREWQRHRIGCITGDTLITLVEPRGVAKQKTIKEIYDLKYGGVIDQMPGWAKNGKKRNGEQAYTKRRRYKNPERTRILPNCQDRIMRVLDESHMEFTTGKMIDVWQTGIKAVFAVKTVDGKEIKASAEHKFLTRRGWVNTLELEQSDELIKPGIVPVQDRPIPPRLREGIGIWTMMMRKRLIQENDKCYECQQEFNREALVLDHVIPVIEDLRLALDETNLKPMCAICHRGKTNNEQKLAQRKVKLGVKWVKLAGEPQYVGDEPTYDIEIESPHHNYLANNLIVHNSFNEMSGRYKEFENPDFYVPREQDFRTQVGKPGAYTFEKWKGNTKMAQATMITHFNDCLDLYKYYIQGGMAKEQARIVLPLALYSEMYWTINARSLMNFVNLRNSEHAMWEIQQYAQVIEAEWATHMPRSHKAFIENGRVAP